MPYWASQVVLVVKNPPANAGDIRDASLIPGLGSSPREGNGNPLQYSCQENPTDRGAWQATVPGVAKSLKQLKRLSTHSYAICFFFKLLLSKLEKGMASRSSILAWKIPWTEDPGGLQSMGSQRVRQDWATNHITLSK